MPSAAATFSRVRAVQARAVAHPDYRRIFSDVALGLGSMTALAAMAGTATVTAAWMVASSFAHDPDLRPAAPTVLDIARLPKPHRHLAGAADRFGSALAAANPVYVPLPMRMAALTRSGNVAWASSPVPMPRPMPLAAPHTPQQRTAALENAIPLPQPRPARMAHAPVTHKTTSATAAPHLARVLTVLPTPRPVENSQTTEPELARISASRAAAVPTIESIISASLAADARRPPRQHEPDRLSPPAAAPQIPFSIPERAETASASPPVSAVRKHRDAQLAYNNPDLPSGPDRHTAFYDIVAHTVYLPDGERLEAHSGLGQLLDDPRYVSEKGRGATPPNVYNLTLRHPLFHGVQAIRLNPAGDAKMYGRDGILAHTYMLGPSGQSFGCVSFKNYAEFLHAFLHGEIDKLVVVPHLRTAPWAERARRADGKRYAFNTQ
jgi:hypothetical protein